MFFTYLSVWMSVCVPPVTPVTTTYSYRPLCKIDTVAFGRDIFRSRLYNSTVADADEYAELFDSEVKRVMDIHARHYVPDVVAVVSMTFVNCLMKRGKRSNSVVGLKVDIGAPVWSLTGAPLSVRLFSRTQQHHEVKSRPHQVETR